MAALPPEFIPNVLTCPLKARALTRRILLTCIVFFTGLNAGAQNNLLCLNEQTGEVLMLAEGSSIYLEYKGYLGQLSRFKGRITHIGDSFLTLSHRQDLFSPRLDQRIRISDIIGMRHYGNLYLFGKPVVQLALVAGSIYLYTGVLSGSTLPPLARLGFATGTGIVSFYLVKLLFPEKITMSLGEGWRFISAGAVKPEPR